MGTFQHSNLSSGCLKVDELDDKLMDCQRLWV